ncbi:hypothetical protein H9639_05885 [Arthrobacter sp. Sa2CUA1]|uniref:PEGA domain-containing protein n=1 Tax=Arthrobacter gallicola TaxID=2762225 RepID=A0ABR8UQK9_9MICC|nr:hypothetical protein [Arthrobacter gallicola]MBD7994826.1 hypothetical protein [Arthrobacter gallicola]
MAPRTRAADDIPRPATELRPRASRRRTRRGKRTAVGLAAAGALLLITAGIIGFRFLSHEVYGPQAQVDAYLAALASGDQSAAVALLPHSEAITPEDAGIYAAAEDRITGFRVLGEEITGSEAVVRAELEQNGGRSTVEFELQADGQRLLFFTGWQLQHTAARTVAVTVPSGTGTLRINGRDLQLPSAGAGTVEVRLLPGRYRLEGPDTRYLTFGSPHTVLVEPGMAGDPDPVRLAASVTEELAAEVQAQGEAYLRDCLDREETAPVACPNAAYTSDGDTAGHRAVQWTEERAPVYRITGTPDTGLTVYATGGKARVTYQEDAGGDGRWETRSDLVNIPFTSELELAGNTLKLNFRP